MSRFETPIELPARWARRLFRKVGKYTVDACKHTLFNLLPPPVLNLLEAPLEKLQVSPKQLAVLAHRVS